MLYGTPQFHTICCCCCLLTVIAGLRSTQGTLALSNSAELATASAAGQQPSTSVTNSSIPRTLSELDAASLLALPPSGGTRDPLLLSAIPLLLAPQVCVIQQEPAAPSQPRVISILQLTGRPKALTAARAAQLAALQAQAQMQHPAAVTPAEAAAVPAAYADILEQHNSYRARHQAQALQWDEALAAAAAAYAAQCVFDHDVASTSGESLYAAADSTDTARSLANAVHLW